LRPRFFSRCVKPAPFALSEVEGLPFLCVERKDSASTSSARTEVGAVVRA